MKKLTTMSVLLLGVMAVSATLTSCFCEHEWKEATCIEPKTCGICKTTRGSALNHSVEAWEIVTEPTCKNTGVKTGLCISCNNEIIEEVKKLEHTPGEWVIKKEATFDTKGEKIQNCTGCSEIIKTEKYSLSNEEKKELYKNNCKVYSYKEISRNPSEYKGKKATFTGEVIQVLRENMFGKTTYNMRVNVTKGDYSYSDTVFVTYYASEDEPYILEDDIITMYGELTGEKTYESIFGATITIPSFTAEYIDVK